MLGLCTSPKQTSHILKDLKDYRSRKREKNETKNVFSILCNYDEGSPVEEATDHLLEGLNCLNTEVEYNVVYTNLNYYTKHQK